MNSATSFIDLESYDLFSTKGSCNNVNNISLSVLLDSTEYLLNSIPSSFALFNKDLILIVEYNRYGPVLPSKSVNLFISKI